MASKRLTYAIDGLLIVAAIAIGFRFVRAVSTSTASPGVESPSLKSGDRLGLEIGSWAAQRNVFVLVSSRCGACADSVPFYREVAKEAQRGGATMTLISPEETQTIQAWATSSGIRADRIERVRDVAALGLTVFPTLLITDQGGVVQDIVAKKLSAEAEKAVFARIAGHGETIDANVRPVPQITLGQVNSRAVETIQIVDIRDRAMAPVEHPLKQAPKYIPLDELATRAPVELRRDTPVAVACMDEPPTRCRAAIHILEENGFANVSKLVR